MGVKGVPKGIPQKDNYSRLSYLYQLSSSFEAQKKYDIISRNLIRNMNGIAKKTVLKLSPSIKRTICKKCNNLLIPGISVKIYIENKSRKKLDKCDVLVHSCLTCGTNKRFPVGQDRDYVVFHERDGVRVD